MNTGYAAFQQRDQLVPGASAFWNEQVFVIICGKNEIPAGFALCGFPDEDFVTMCGPDGKPLFPAGGIRDLQGNNDDNDKWGWLLKTFPEGIHYNTTADKETMPPPVDRVEYYDAWRGNKHVFGLALGEEWRP